MENKQPGNEIHEISPKQKGIFELNRYVEDLKKSIKEYSSEFDRNGIDYRDVVEQQDEALVMIENLISKIDQNEPSDKQIQDANKMASDAVFAVRKMAAKKLGRDFTKDINGLEKSNPHQ